MLVSNLSQASQALCFCSSGSISRCGYMVGAGTVSTRRSTVHRFFLNVVDGSLVMVYVRLLRLSALFLTMAANPLALQPPPSDSRW